MFEEKRKREWTVNRIIKFNRKLACTITLDSATLVKIAIIHRCFMLNFTVYEGLLGCFVRNHDSTIDFSTIYPDTYRSLKSYCINHPIRCRWVF